MPISRTAINGACAASLSLLALRRHVGKSRVRMASMGPG
jgi:hypothetical protein